MLQEEKIISLPDAIVTVFAFSSIVFMAPFKKQNQIYFTLD